MPPHDQSRFRALGRATRRLFRRGHHVDHEEIELVPQPAGVNLPAKGEQVTVLPPITRTSGFSDGLLGADHQQVMVVGAAGVVDSQNAAPPVVLERDTTEDAARPAIRSVPATAPDNSALQTQGTVSTTDIINATNALEAMIATLQPTGRDSPGPPPNYVPRFDLPIRSAEPDAPAIPDRTSTDSDDQAPDVPPPGYEDHENDEPFPRQYHPFHEDHIDRNSNQSWVLPGAEHYPIQNVRATNPNAVTDFRQIENVTVGGRLFFLPVSVLDHSPFFHFLRHQQRPAEVWDLPDINPDLFALILDVLIRGALTGTEQGLNLPRLLEAIQLASELGISAAVDALSLTIPRYITERCFFLNPWDRVSPQVQAILFREHFTYRSEDIYRAWQVIQRHPRLQVIINREDLYLLYVYIIPRDMWPVRAAEFDQLFIDAINQQYGSLGGDPADTFLDVWAQFQRLTLRVNNTWFPRTGLDVETVFGSGPARQAGSSSWPSEAASVPAPGENPASSSRPSESGASSSGEEAPPSSWPSRSAAQVISSHGAPGPSSWPSSSSSVPTSDRVPARMAAVAFYIDDSDAYGDDDGALNLPLRLVAVPEEPEETVEDDNGGGRGDVDQNTNE